MIQSAVQAAMIQVNAAGLDASIKEVLSSTPALFPLFSMLSHPYIVFS
jgi:hypothetical protein